MEISRNILDRGFLANPHEIGSQNDKTLFDAFLDYFKSPQEEESKDLGATSKNPLPLKTKLKQCLENVPFDYTSLFEATIEPNQDISTKIQSLKLYEILNGTKYFDDEELKKLINGVYLQLSQGQIYAIFILFEIIILNKDRISITFPLL